MLYYFRIPIDLRSVFTRSVKSVLMDYLYRKRTIRKDGSVPNVIVSLQKTNLKMTLLSGNCLTWRKKGVIKNLLTLYVVIVKLILEMPNGNAWIVRWYYVTPARKVT